ncbi:MAG: lipocalin family protein [Bacteroidales bacterium]|nr:lipocalin family protein [Bacteroidales bacterium]
MKLVLSSLSLMALLLTSMLASFDNSTVPYLDLPRYMGTWYEIARFDHSFEKGLQFATAKYSMRPDGKVRVVNSGYKNGERKISEGKAKTTDTPGLLRVSFFGPFYSDYRVLMLTSNYDYALVGSRSKKYLWVLSRTPDMPLSILNSILDEAKARGYNTNRLIMVKQEY